MGLFLRTDGDSPFLKMVTEVTVAAMAIVAREVKGAVRMPMGINVLRNDYRSALSIDGIVNCEFVRINIMVGAYVNPKHYQRQCKECASFAKKRCAVMPDLL